MRWTVRRRNCFPLLAVLVWLGSAQASPAGAPGARLDALPQSWRDDSAQPFRLADLAGHRVVLSMAYANCHRICPRTLRDMQQLQQALDEEHLDAEFVIVGADPDEETPRTWRHFREQHHLGRANWHFLTGDRGDTEQLARQLHFELWRYDEHVMHDAHVLLFDTHGAFIAEAGPTTPAWPTTL